MARQPKKTIPRVPNGRPQIGRLSASKGEGTKPGSSFDYAGPLTEVVLLGNIAVRMPGTKIEWGGKEMKSTNSEMANALISKEYREF
jgi:hypothetical protein